eukprot:3102161-Rhodomonas_salina.1
MPMLMLMSTSHSASHSSRLPHELASSGSLAPAQPQQTTPKQNSCTRHSLPSPRWSHTRRESTESRSSACTRCRSRQEGYTLGISQGRRGQ